MVDSYKLLLTFVEQNTEISSKWFFYVEVIYIGRRRIYNCVWKYKQNVLGPFSMNCIIR